MSFRCLILCGAGGLWWTSVLNLALPPQRHRPDTWPEHQEPVSHTAKVSIFLLTVTHICLNLCICCLCSLSARFGGGVTILNSSPSLPSFQVCSGFGEKSSLPGIFLKSSLFL